MQSNSPKRFWYVILLLLILATAGVLSYTVMKLNNKVNSLHDAVVSLEGYVDQSIKDLREENNAVNSQLGIIPDLYPHGEGWKITQYGDVSGKQEMCYTITTDNGLAIIDGGWEYEEDRLRKIIAQYGNSVDAWILTHPHNDHMTAFLDIYKDPQGIAIHHVYTVEMPEMPVLMANAYWDDYSLLEELLALNIPELEYLHIGDERNILGLSMKVFSAYEDEIDPISDDLLNDGSMVFKLSGERESMLFCGDAGSALGNTALSDMIIARFKDELKSDYLQMGHHGFGGLSWKLYDLVDAKAVFFDAPAWHITSTGRISSRENDLRMESQGRVVYSFFTAPNQILLR